MKASDGPLLHDGPSLFVVYLQHPYDVKRRRLNRQKQATVVALVQMQQMGQMMQVWALAAVIGAHEGAVIVALVALVLEHLFTLARAGGARAGGSWCSSWRWRRTWGRW
jgi:hypothetical protein